MARIFNETKGARPPSLLSLLEGLPRFRRGLLVEEFMDGACVECLRAEWDKRDE